MSHDELKGLAEGYALSALDADELKQFEAHLDACQECLASVAELRLPVDALSMMNDEAEPAGNLRERILASARAEPRNQEQPVKSAPWWLRPVLRPIPVAAVFAGLVAVIMVVAVWGSQADGDLSSVQRRLSLTYDGIEIMAQAEQWWRFDGSGITSGAAGTLAYSEEIGAACLLVWGLAEADHFNYQVRLTEADGAVTVRKMWRYDDAMWLILDGDPNLLQKLEIMLFNGETSPDSETPPLPVLIDIPLTAS
ncbi:MAG: hypothetical protein HQ475_00785 [SAR202 cluster bacterium]|nr:hypothetical protein [SAR202 cluster bacterium]